MNSQVTKPYRGREKISEIAPAGGTGSLRRRCRGGSGGLKRFIKVLGLGLIIGASDDDSSGISTYAIATCEPVVARSRRRGK